VIAGTSTLIWYKNHHEAVLVFAGEGEIEVVGPDQKEGEGKVYKLGPGTFYGLDGHERHFLRATKGDMEVACAFNPPIAGSEDHDSEGVYPAVDDSGKKHFKLDKEATDALIQPPKTMRH
jgi:L-ectoine synthase